MDFAVISIVIPLYNEAESIPQLHEQLTAALAAVGEACEVIVVDDGSTDGSFEQLRRLHEADPCLKVIRFRRNFGQTAALAAGFDAAQGDVIVTLDADLQNDPADIPRLLARLAEGYDVVSGWRVHRRDPFHRRWPSHIANWLISRVTGVQLHDYGCSLKAYRSEVVKNIRLYGELHRFIPAIASWMGVRVAELPVNHRPRAYGRSKYGSLRRTVKVFLDLLTVRFLLSYATRPIHIFGGLGLLAALVGGAIGLYLSYAKLVLGESIGNRPLLTLGVLLMIVGVQMISMGLLGELVVRTYHESQGKPIYVVRERLGF
ncbi:MAG: glycosyltransferase family 2 protein [Anaerolineae bacterium]|nr:glycosyltransferase family 2 protein [Anaerolineae bacterium]